jgi:hypothetical protein
VSERRRLCSRWVSSTSFWLSRVIKSSGMSYLMVMNVNSEWANIALVVVDGLIDVE